MPKPIWAESLVSWQGIFFIKSNCCNFSVFNKQRLLSIVRELGNVMPTCRHTYQTYTNTQMSQKNLILTVKILDFCMYAEDNARNW